MNEHGGLHLYTVPIPMQWYMVRGVRQMPLPFQSHYKTLQRLFVLLKVVSTPACVYTSQL